MKLQTMPKFTAVEVLRYLAENEDLFSIEKLSAADLTVPQVRSLIREIANELEREASAEHERYDVKNCDVLSKKAKSVVSCLSPREEQSLLSIFGLIDKKQP